MSEAREELDPRKAAILRTVVSRYIATAQPVGSAHVVRDAAIDVSAATVRADMAALERDGYLHQPHTSAGRVPTDKGYRFFVDHLSRPRPLPRVQQERVRDFFARTHGELERMLRDTSRLLSELTELAAVVVAPQRESLRVRSVLVVRIASRAALAVVVCANGATERHLVECAEDVTDADAEAASTWLQLHLRDQPLATASAPAVGEPAVDRLVTAVVEALRRSRPELDPAGEVFVGGASRISQQFDAVEKVRAVLGILEQSYVVVSLLRDVLAHGQRVSIGTEHGVEPLAECSLVVAPYALDEGAAGTIGILGPTRMDYGQALAAVAVVGRELSERLRAS